MARHLIQNAATGETRIVGTSALPFFPGFAIVDTYDDGIPPAVFYGAGEADLRYVNVTELSNPTSAASVALRAAFGAQIDEELAPYTPLNKLAATALASGRRVAFGIDSLTVGANATNASVDAFVPMVSKILGTARVPGSGTFARINAGVGGNTVAQFLARMDADVIVQDPDVLVFLGGTNPSADFATFCAGVAEAHARCIAAGIVFVLCTIPPRGAGTVDTTQHERTNSYNLFLRTYAAQHGLPQPELFAALVDPATGYLATGYNSDETHLTPAGHAVAAATISAVLDKLLPPSPLRVAAPGAPGLIANPINAGGTSTTSPTGWTNAATGTGTIVRGSEDPAGADKLVAFGGKWYRINVDNTAGGSSSTDVRYQALSGSHLAGDKILYTYVVKSSEADGSGVSVQLASGSTVLSTTSFVGVQAPGRMASIQTLAADAATLRLRISVTTPAGAIRSGYIGEVQAWNLTQLGLVDQF